MSLITNLTIEYWKLWSTAIPHNGGFLPVFIEGNVPLSQPYPFMTYNIIKGKNILNGGSVVLTELRIFTNQGNWRQNNDFAGFIWDMIANNSYPVPVGNRGGIIIRAGDPFYQPVPMSDELRNIEHGRIALEIYDYTV